MRAIDEAFELWATEVERLVGRSIDRKAARVAFECYEKPIKALTPMEYAYELDPRVARLWREMELDASRFGAYLRLRKLNPTRESRDPAVFRWIRRLFKR